MMTPPFIHDHNLRVLLYDVVRLCPPLPPSPGDEEEEEEDEKEAEEAEYDDNACDDEDDDDDGNRRVSTVNRRMKRTTTGGGGTSLNSSKNRRMRRRRSEGGRGRDKVLDVVENLLEVELSRPLLDVPYISALAALTAPIPAVRRLLLQYDYQRII